MFQTNYCTYFLVTNCMNEVFFHHLHNFANPVFFWWLEGVYGQQRGAIAVESNSL